MTGIFFITSRLTARWQLYEADQNSSNGRISSNMGGVGAVMFAHRPVAQAATAAATGSSMAARHEHGKRHGTRGNDAGTHRQTHQIRTSVILSHDFLFIYWRHYMQRFP